MSAVAIRSLVHRSCLAAHLQQFFKVPLQDKLHCAVLKVLDGKIERHGEVVVHQVQQSEHAWLWRCIFFRRAFKLVEQPF